MADLDLNALANAPGYGTAAKVLIAAGKRDPADENGMLEYVVSLSAQADVTATITVRANSRKAALDAAYLKADEGDIDWDVDDLNRSPDVEIICGWHE